MLKIGLDAMGGDFAPEATVKGAILASKELLDGSTVVLFGQKGAIEKVLQSEGQPIDMFEIVDTSEVIEMTDHPANAFIKKTDSSLFVGFQWLKQGAIDGLASAGNTGAMMVGGVKVIGLIDQVIRPTISAHIGASNGGSFLLLDVGLNVDCKPEVLHQYATMGHIYAQNVMGIERPRVGLLSIGEEREKGNSQIKATYELLEVDKTLNFIGNVESKYIFSGELVDVVVCDGLVGNIVLKQAEGFYDIVKSEGLHSDYIEKLNYEVIGGTAVLGINANVVVGHGCSTPLAIKNMILQTERTIKGKLVEKFGLIFK